MVYNRKGIIGLPEYKHKKNKIKFNGVIFTHYLSTGKNILLKDA